VPGGGGREANRVVTIVIETKSSDDTADVGAALAPLLRAGDTILLAGDLGAGKTTFTQGLGRALGVTEQITSPTFTLMRGYKGAALTLVHVDVYRVGHLQEIVDLGIEELLDDGAVAVIEWGDIAAPTLPQDFLEVAIGFGDGDDERRLTLRTVGRRWAERNDELARVVDRWAA
jgi:tRNA threonylcarbamoyladenosine biosynthesis protein TsaE